MNFFDFHFLRKRKNTSFALLILILIISAFFRFYALKSWQFFGMDQEYEAFIIRNILTGKHFPLIGVNASDTGIYLGPLFLYFAAIPYAFFGGNPLGGSITASLLGVLTTYLIYFFGKKMFTERIGLFAACMYGGSMLVAFYDRQFWNPSPVPLMSLFIGYFLFEIWNKRINRLPFLAAVYSLSLHVHLSLLIFTPLILYTLYVTRKSLTKKILLTSAGIFLLFLLPLIMFDMRHGFTNLHGFENIFVGKNVSQTKMSFGDRAELFTSMIGRFFWLPVYPDFFLESGQCKELAHLKSNASWEGIIAIVCMIGIFLWWFAQTKHRSISLTTQHIVVTSKNIIIAVFLLTILFVFFYSRQVFEYYYLFFFPWLALMVGISFEMIWKKEHGSLIVVSILALFLILNTFTLFSAKFSYSYEDKSRAIEFSKEYISGNTYSLETVGECPRYGGYTYLYTHYVGYQPVQSYMDSYFAWLYADSLKSVRPSRTVLLSVIDPRDSQENILHWQKEKMDFLQNYVQITQKQFGNIKVYILAPSTVQ